MSENKEKHSIKDCYNDCAEDFSNSWYNDSLMLPILKEFISFFPSAPRILDVGCNSGYESMRLKKLGANVVGVDFSAKTIDIARQKNLDIDFHIVDFTKLKIDIGKFDGVVAIGFLFLFCETEISKVFKNFGKLLNNDGYLLLVMKFGNEIKEKTISIGNQEYLRKEYLRNKKDIDILADNIGLRFYKELSLPQEAKNSIWKYYIYKKDK